MLIAVLPNKFIVLFHIVFGTLSFPLAADRVGGIAQQSVVSVHLFPSCLLSQLTIDEFLHVYRGS